MKKRKLHKSNNNKLSFRIVQSTIKYNKLTETVITQSISASNTNMNKGNT